MADTELTHAVAGLVGAVPVALLPVRIETRFSADRTSLAIRIYPDQIHLDAHEPELTADERTAGEWYWLQRWPAIGDAALAQAAWEQLAARFRPGRSRYVVDLLRPSNLDHGGATGVDPEFPATPSRDASWTRAVEAAALPERWVAIGYQDGPEGPVEVFRQQSEPVPDRLAAGPSPDPGETPPPLDPAAVVPRVQEAFRWAIDPQDAAAAGMLVTIRDSDLPTGHTLAAGLSRLVVLGVDGSPPDRSATTLEGLLRGHVATGDLAFVAQGTPTNNTGTARSGFSTSSEAQSIEWAPPVSGSDPDATATAAAGRLATALGIEGAAMAPSPGASGRFHQTAAALVDALWEATGGYFASDLLAPLGDDATTADLREHATEHLFASGPLPAIRIGPQPYGVLPVVAPGAFHAAGGDRAGATIARVASAMRTLWAPLVARVPHLGRAGDQGAVDPILLELLQRTPVPWRLRWREMVPPPQWSSTDWLQRYRTYQAPYLYTVMDLLGVPRPRAARVQYLTAAEDSHALEVPLVVKGDEGVDYLAEIAAQARAGDEGRRQLNLRQNSVALLEALLAFAAAQEQDKAATAELAATLTPDVAAASGLERKGIRTPDLVRVDVADATRAPFAFTSARELAAAVLPTTGALVHDAVADRLVTNRLVDLVRRRTDPGHGMARYLTAVDTLTSADPDELEWAFRGVLDLYSSRLDAWYTSLAHARLHRHRAAQPTGIHLGCYGWVEDLAPDSGAAAESLGHVLAPSLSHAVAAAVLRSGRQSHQAEGAFDLDLTAARVREALALLEGVASGQSIAALVGYRIERRLRDVGLAELTVPLRIEAPLQSRDAEHEQPVESVAARDVVDGVRLLTIFAGGGPQPWDAVMARLGVTGTKRTRLDDLLREVAGRYDAVTDVLFAETIHQTAAGNLDRASAAAAALDRQERPVEPEVARTPRSGATVANRVLVTLRTATRAPRWPGRGPRGAAEPRLDHWLGTVLGPAADLTAGGDLVRSGPNPGDPEVVVDLGVVTASDLGLSPLALVLAAQRPAGDRPSELEARIVYELAQRVPDPRETDRIELRDHTLFGTVAGWAGRLAAGARPLAPTDLIQAEAHPSEAGAAGAVDVVDLTRRATAAVTALRRAAGSLRRASRTPAARRDALLAVSELVGAEALPVVTASHPDAAVRLGEQLESVLTTLDGTVAAADQLAAEPVPAGDDASARPLAVIRLALGAHQPVLPVFTLTRPGDLAASAADTELVGPDRTAPIAWLHQHALVRPDLDPLCGVLTHAEAGGVDVVDHLVVAQLPHRPGARWCALAFGAEGPPPAGTVGFVIVTPDRFDPATPMAGLAVDAWAEVIPEREHTAGLAFHYDAPGARPPQVVVLAVHPQPDPASWDLDTLVATVNETIELTHLRALTLKELDGFAGLLPALFLPNNYTRDVPSVSFKGLVDGAAARGLLTADIAGVVGK